MGAPILITGGTGTLGRHLADRLRADGRPVRILSRRTAPGGTAAADWATGDLRTGEGVPEALTGVETVVHCASDFRRPRGDAAAADLLLRAAREVGVRHLVYISIVGADRVPLGYYRTKVAVEEKVRRSGLPWTILRTTQFHELLARIARVLTAPPVAFVPAGLSFQPVAAEEVADRLAELAVGAPAGRVTDLGGPDVRRLSELVRVHQEAGGRRRRVVPVRLPGRVVAAYRSGVHLAPDHAEGRITFEEHLAGRLV